MVLPSKLTENEEKVQVSSSRYEAPETDETSIEPSAKADMKRDHEGALVSVRRNFPYHIGQHLDVLDSVGRWSEAVVMKVDQQYGRMYVSYLFWSDNYNEWIEDIPNKTAYLHTHTYVNGGVLRVGQRIEVLDEKNKWLESFVIEERPAEVS